MSRATAWATVQHEVDGSSTSRVTVFATLWSFAHLFHLLIHGQVGTNWTMWIVAVAAVRVVSRPSATGRLAALRLPSNSSIWWHISQTIQITGSSSER